MHPRRINASSHVLKAHKSRLGRAIIDMDIHDISIEGPGQLPHAMIERRSGSSLSVATSRAWGLRLFSLDMCNSRTPAFHLATCCRFIYAPLACVCVCFNLVSSFCQQAVGKMANAMSISVRDTFVWLGAGKHTLSGSKTSWHIA